MKAAFALLLDHDVHNVVRKLAVGVHHTYHTGLAGSQLPPHVLLKQPFLIADLSALEAYFDQSARSIAPLPLTFPRIGGPGDAPVLWLEVAETEMLQQLHTSINQELAARFQETQAPFDGPAYHFHLTIALGGASSAVYRSMVATLASQYVPLQTIARQLALFYYDDDQISPGSFLTYKILPLGKTAGDLGNSHYAQSIWASWPAGAVQQRSR